MNKTTSMIVLAITAMESAVADDCSFFYDLGCKSGQDTNVPDMWGDERSF